MKYRTTLATALALSVCLLSSSALAANASAPSSRPASSGGEKRGFSLQLSRWLQERLLSFSFSSGRDIRPLENNPDPPPPDPPPDPPPPPEGDRSHCPIG